MVTEVVPVSGGADKERVVRCLSGELRMVWSEVRLG